VGAFARLIDEKPLVDFVYCDRGSLVSLSRFSTVGSLMGNLIVVGHVNQIVRPRLKLH
tara:strand:- start:2984 stop:3157 length:174 start_codon:yes stop_codon:yes gene_type:complete